MPRRGWHAAGVLECVVNVSEGRDAEVLAALAAAAGDALLDLHADPHHHRAVLTLVGQDAVRAVADVAVARIDLRRHQGVHPRLGAIDVVPFVALTGSDGSEAVEARDAFGAWLAERHAVPCFRYGPERSLPEVRRGAFSALSPDTGPSRPHPSAGACAIGARDVLVAYNLWLAGTDLERARRIAAAVRGDGIRALGLDVGGRLQVSLNLVEPLRVGPGAAHDRVSAAAGAEGDEVTGAELVGLVPAAVLHREPAGRWRELDLGEDRTIEARLEARGWAGS
jgi:glutamate formiminotransferase / 5-formyltetrahydrofolate cyclo-ligase